jgi:hypothetical protein
MKTDSISSRLEPLAWPLLFVALLLVLTPLTDFLVSVWPIQPGNVRWRFASAAMLSGFLFTPILGAVLGAAAAAVLDNRAIQRLAASVSLAGAIALLAILSLFVLDTLQARSEIPSEALNQFQVSAVRALLKHLSAMIALAWLSIAGFRTGRTPLGVVKGVARPVDRASLVMNG